MVTVRLIFCDADNILSSIRSILNLEIDFDCLTSAGRFCGKGLVIYHGRTPCKYLQCFHTVIIGHPAVVTPVEVIPGHGDDWFIHFINDTLVVCLRVATGAWIDIEYCTCCSRISQWVIDSYRNRIYQSVFSTGCLYNDFKIAVVIRLHLHRISKCVFGVCHYGVILRTIHFCSVLRNGEDGICKSSLSVINRIIKYHIILPVDELWGHIIHAHQFHYFPGCGNTHDIYRYRFGLNGIIWVGQIEIHIVYSGCFGMRKYIVIRCIHIDGCSQILGIALIVIITGNGDMKHFVDITVDNHWNWNIPGKGGPPSEVRGTDSQWSELYNIGDRGRSLVGVLSLDTYFDIVAAACQPLGYVLFDGYIRRNFHLLHCGEVCKLRVLYHDCTQPEFSRRLVRFIDIIPILGDEGEIQDTFFSVLCGKAQWIQIIPNVYTIHGSCSACQFSDGLLQCRAGSTIIGSACGVTDDKHLILYTLNCRLAGLNIVVIDARGKLIQFSNNLVQLLSFKHIAFEEILI